MSETPNDSAAAIVGPTCSASGPEAAARAAAGLGFLALAGGVASRRIPAGIALWPLALVPTWFGISHLIASVTGYRGCPELGAIPSVMLARPVVTRCGPWEWIDRRLAQLATTVQELHG